VTPQEAIDRRLNKLENQFFARGVVIAISADGLTLTVDARGSTYLMPKLASYATPNINDAVEIAWPPGRPFVLGPLG
jgi:hypothetical protein